MKQQNGFTLIELVVVIIILGILAVTAAPKFINLQSDARESALQGLRGAMQGANSLVYAKAAIDGKETLSTTGWAADDDDGLDIGAEDLAVTNFGYLQAGADELNNAIDAEFGTTNTEWIVGTPSGTPLAIIINQAGAPNDSNTCQITYTEAESTSVLPTYVIVDTGC
ncbi:prepilin-type N-terminal cleavage/methylation domain-containing protein [Shewanella eurypsychrophilus]|uniref:Prepilin-type N-terminal cleavage/methylation domain-containing protein n=1 Tax=Shewanella eurypsychrophilus TaxID=2593656 RepID=A0ABX6VBF0_9GAMM|nr:MULTISPECIES: prepilin-type N-terminal cleavage/methylation domain-containing protein [Shewanella]QFU24647.1 prepilin-type N-terminal cleavage/methylation domain-containing protein [Shewanella sp. YLB-09]QPG59841.1 prepilin-type N-terminal cleavage/methylation domain-containing protein [Shewanella eurypsychrophilus]